MLDKKVMKVYFKKLIWVLLISLPIIIFLLPFLTNTKGVLPGDWDYFAQLYEAARRSILEFNQFPWWNPWIAGGIPLYANPQFGLVSIQMPLVLAFGTLEGLRFSILIFFLIGFWGMRSLLLRLKTDRVIAILLSYIWVFSGFPAWRISGGHFTFTVYFLAPLFFLLLLNIRKRMGWLWFGLFAALVMNQSLHYMTVYIVLIGGVIALYQVVKLYRKHEYSIWEIVKPYVFSAAIVIPLIAHKLYFTLQYLHDFPRTPPVEAGVPFNIITAALTFRGTKVINPANFYQGGFGWGEYAAYFGLLALGLFAYLIIKKLQKPKTIQPKFILLLVGMVLILLLALGDFSALSPYALMKHLPIFDQMQVSTRWLCWFVFGAIIFLSQLPRKRLFVVILGLTIVDVFLSSYHVINTDPGRYIEPQKNLQFQQQAFYKNTPDFSASSLRLYSATESNIGDIYGYEPLVGFGNIQNEGYAGLSNRCASNRSECPFVITNNAEVSYWSPNLIKLTRTGPGNIAVNQNPGSYWLVNGVRQFKPYEVVELKQDFIISDPSNDITLQIDPSFLYR